MSDSIGAGTVAGEEPRWPRVVSTVGIVLGALTIFDKLDDLFVPLVWPAESWSALLEPDVAEFVLSAIPSGGLLATVSMTGIALGILLIIGSLRLRRHRSSGVSLCRLWAWLAIVWHVASLGVGVLWVVRHAEDMSRLAGGDWQGPVTFGLLVALVVMLAWPLFLLWWLGRPQVHELYQYWTDED